MKIYLAPLTTSVLLSLFSFNVSAELISQVLLTEKDWSVTQITDSETQVTHCVAETKKVTSTINTELKLVLPGAEDQSTQIILTAKGVPAEITTAYVRPNSKTLYPMLLLSTDAESETSQFILLPHRNAEVIDLIKEQSILDVYFGEGKTAVLARVSLKGSTKVVQKTTECRASKSLVNEDISDKIKKDLKKIVPVEGTLQQVLDLDAQLLSLDAQLKAKKIELSTTQAGLKEQKSKDSDLKAKIASISKLVVKSQKEVSDIKLKLEGQQNLLAQSQTELPIHQEQIPALVAAKDAAQIVLDPIKAQVRRLESELSSLQKQQDSLEGSVHELSSRRSQIINDLNQMNWRLEQLRQERNRIDQQASQTGDLLRRKDFEYRNYDVELETRRALESSWEYRNLRDELERLRRQKEQLPGQIAQAQAQVSAREVEVETCRAAQPPQDCSAQIARLQEARALLNSKNSEMNGLNNQIENTRARMQRVEQNINMEIRRVKDRLQSEVNQLSNQMRELELAARNIDQEVRDIQQFQIPRAQQDLRNTESSLAQAEDRLVDATARTRRKQSELSQYKKENQYELLSNNLKAAQKALSEVQSALETAQENITELPAKIEATTKSLTTAEAKLTGHSTNLATEEANLAVVTTAINDLLNLEKATSDAIAELDKTIAADILQFQGVVKFLTPVP